MQGTEVYNVLKGIRATHLHHANSVTTSCTFLEQRALASRGFVEDHNLMQTVQSSDQLDKKYGIWHRIFVDHVDIHYRGGRKKGPNQYGPVLFVLDLDILSTLPAGSTVRVTKSNPVHWYDNQPDSERYFQTVEELTANIHLGDFDKMLVIQTPSDKLDFPNRRARIVLDEPERKLSSGDDAYDYAEARLKSAAKTGRVQASISPHVCQDGCICVETYARWNADIFDQYFM